MIKPPISAAGLDDPDGAPLGVRRAELAAALHELAESLTASTNYIAAIFHRMELAGSGNTGIRADVELLGKALTQLDRAANSLNSLQQLLSEQEP
jgi:hypothetical protein